VLTLAAGLPSWAAPSGGGSPGGSNTMIQYNNSGVFGGLSTFVYNGGGVTTDDGTGFQFASQGDNTARAYFIVGSTTGNTRTFTLQDTSGTVALLDNGLGNFASTTSAQLAGVISDETGSGELVFGTSPTITTSLVAGSATMALLNTVATTINFAGVATTLNIGASAATVLNFGGHTSAAEFRFLEPSGSGTNYTGFIAVAQGANITYQLPATAGSAGNVLAIGSPTGTVYPLSWTSGGSGDVVGPSGATDNAIARYDTTTGKLIQDSVVTIADTTGVIAGTQGITLSGTTSGTTSLVATAIAGTTISTLPATTTTLAGLAVTQTFTAANTFSLAGSTGVAITISGAGSTTNAGLTFTSSSRGWINMGTSGDAVGAPTFTTRSQGTKIVLYPLVAGATVDYALGINTNVLWTSVPDSARSFLWYAGTTTVLTLSGAGNITTVGSLTMADAKDIILNTTTGTKIGTATTQKLAVWNATPIVQPTTAVAAATFVANTSLIANDTATFDGYTLGQVVKALRNIGLLA